MLYLLSSCLWPQAAVAEAIVSLFMTCRTKFGSTYRIGQAIVVFFLTFCPLSWRYWSWVWNSAFPGLYYSNIKTIWKKYIMIFFLCHISRPWLTVVYVYTYIFTSNSKTLRTWRFRKASKCRRTSGTSALFLFSNKPKKHGNGVKESTSNCRGSGAHNAWLPDGSAVMHQWDYSASEPSAAAYTKVNWRFGAWG